MRQRKSIPDQIRFILNKHIVNRKLVGIQIPNSPARIFWTVACAVFVVEALIMFLLMMLPEMNPVTTAMVDAFLLVVLISPVFFYFLFQPLTNHIAERKVAESHLLEHKDMLQTVFDGISDPLMLLDDDMRIKMLNQSAIEYYGVELQGVYNLPCYEAFKHHGLACDECRISEVAWSNRTITFERPSPLEPGDTEQVVIYRSAAKGGKPGAVIIRISDITEAKNMERQMLQQEKMASLGLLISSVAHEINNPNNMIAINLPILRDYLKAILPAAASSENKDALAAHLNLSFEDLEKDAFELLTNIEHGSERITSIVSQLKEFSRINKQKEIRHVDLQQIIEKAVAICQTEIKRYVSSFEMDIPHDFPKIYTNSEYIEQVLVNLIVNACHAADKVDAWIKLRIYSGHTWDKHVIIEVSDNGHGMTTDTMKNIFEPLFTTKEEMGGTGLGLYVSYNLVANLGGRLEAESSFGQGSTFRICLTDRERRSRKRFRHSQASDSGPQE